MVVNDMDAIVHRWELVFREGYQFWITLGGGQFRGSRGTGTRKPAAGVTLGARAALIVVFALELHCSTLYAARLRSITADDHSPSVSPTIMQP